ncbi:hypothetical protein BO70DRAFT_392658 [Aspergillus heteromorphus CBS 117.55]|uniref:Uncharacterized protein n=1 Tax=Aspergillus heteromorphus CBS 117.55 TaxID=1448321 RepID=A0A317WYI1_9EURO|nr:uncharacterized protein BO70DRAFT_392658 [Aspergillus heteromorphus CBS 117.55]PWY90991.1 hypothetical protein BO70DRAFT_392658 [Aspergillus heteromorphus CBS 117.55]
MIGKNDVGTSEAFGRFADSQVRLQKLAARYRDRMPGRLRVWNLPRSGHFGYAGTVLPYFRYTLICSIPPIPAVTWIPVSVTGPKYLIESPKRVRDAQAHPLRVSPRAFANPNIHIPPAASVVLFQYDTTHQLPRTIFQRLFQHLWMTELPTRSNTRG